MSRLCDRRPPPPVNTAPAGRGQGRGLVEVPRGHCENTTNCKGNVGADAHPACTPRPWPAPRAALAQTGQVEGRTGSRCAHCGHLLLALSPENLRGAIGGPEKGLQWILPKSRFWGPGSAKVGMAWMVGTWTDVTDRTSCPSSQIIPIRTARSDVFFSLCREQEQNHPQPVVLTAFTSHPPIRVAATLQSDNRWRAAASCAFTHHFPCT